jgi:glycosyltransferase involved in cell wall biosynthesis
MPTVTIVTPSYNQGQFIERTIYSVLSQKVSGVEYLIFDGGSKDDTKEVLKWYGTRVKYVMEPDGGQADAVNKGFRAATGEVVGWLNSDDIYYPEAIKTVCDYFDRNPHVDVVYGDANHIDASDSVMEPYPTEDWDFERLQEICYICQPATFLRRRVFEKFGLLDPTLGWALDYEYWIRLAQGGAVFGHLKAVLAGSRLHSETKTLGSPVKVHREINEVLKLRLGKVPDKWLYAYAHLYADSKKISRKSTRGFTLAVSALSLCSALRWNRRVSPAMWKQVRQWSFEGTPR